MTIYDASMKYQKAGVPLVVLGGKEYGSGSSRDWAAKGTLLLGVRAVIAESFERIHRSNLLGMGVLPLQYRAGDTAQSLGLTGFEEFTIEGVAKLAPGMAGEDCARHKTGRGTMVSTNFRPPTPHEIGKAHRLTSLPRENSLSTFSFKKKKSHTTP